jgi:hypothetical protein
VSEQEYQVKTEHIDFALSEAAFAVILSVRGLDPATAKLIGAISAARFIKHLRGRGIQIDLDDLQDMQEHMGL